MKICSKCKESKPLDGFNKDKNRNDGLFPQCKRCVRAYKQANKERLAEYSKQYKKDNREATLAARAAWRVRNRELLAKRQREYYRDNKKVVLAAQNEYYKKRYNSDPAFRISRLIRNRILQALDGNDKSARTIELIGCTPEQFRQHIESQFTEGMDWNQRGLWHLDHQIPIAAFDLKKPKHQRYAFHWSNTTPLWAAENLAKSDEYCPDELEAYLKSELPSTYKSA